MAKSPRSALRAGVRAHSPVPKLAQLGGSFPLIRGSIAPELSGWQIPLALAEAEWVQFARGARAGVPGVVGDRVPLASAVLFRRSAMSALAPSLEAYFTDRLVSQRASSPNTIAAYALTFRLLLAFASRRTGSPPSRLDIAELDAPLIAAFLEHLERDRHNAVATRNMRLAAVHSLFSYLALHHPEHAGSIQRVLSIPQKRAESNLITYLVEDEVTALLEACDLRSWTGRRDHAMFALTIQTGLRISELVGLRCENLSLGRGANVHTLGKGERSDAPRSFRARSSSSRRGFANGEELSPTRSFRRVPGGASVAKPSSGDSLATSPWLGQVVLRSLRSA